MSGNKQREVDDQGNFVIDLTTEVLFEPIPNKTNQNLSHKLEKVHNLNELKIQLQEKLKSLPMKDDTSKTQHIVEQINEIIKQCDVVISQIQEKNNDEFDFVIDKQIKEVNDKVMHFETHINFVRDQAKRDAEGKARELAELEKQKSKQKIQVSVASKTKVINKEHFNDILPEDNFTKSQKKLIAQDPRLADEIRQQKKYELEMDRQKAEKELAAKLEQAAKKDTIKAEKERAAKLEEAAKLERAAKNAEMKRYEAEQARDLARSEKERAIAAEKAQAARLAAEIALDAKFAKEREQAARLENEIRQDAERARAAQSMKLLSAIVEVKKNEPPFKLYIVPENHNYKTDGKTDNVATADDDSTNAAAQAGIGVNEFQDIANEYRKVAKLYSDCVVDQKAYSDEEEKKVVKLVETLNNKTRENVWLNEELKRITYNYKILYQYVLAMRTQKELVLKALVQAQTDIPKPYVLAHSSLNMSPINADEYKNIPTQINTQETKIKEQDDIVKDGTTTPDNQITAEDKRDELQNKLYLFKNNYDSADVEYKILAEDINLIYREEAKLYDDEYINITIKKHNPSAQLQVVYAALNKLHTDCLKVKKHMTCEKINTYIIELAKYVNVDRLKIYENSPRIDIKRIYENIKTYFQKVKQNFETQKTLIDNAYKALLKKKEADRLVVSSANEAKIKITNLIDEHKLNVQSVVTQWQSALLEEIDKKKLDYITEHKSLPFTEKIKLLVEQNNEYYGNDTKQKVIKWYKAYHDTTITRLNNVETAAHKQVDDDVKAPGGVIPPAPALPGAAAIPPAPALLGGVIPPAPALPPVPIKFDDAYTLKVLSDNMKFKDKTSTEKKIVEYKLTDVNILKIDDVAPKVEMKAAAPAAGPAAIEHSDELTDIVPIDLTDSKDLSAALTAAVQQITDDEKQFSNGVNDLDQIANIRDEYKKLYIESAQRDTICTAYSELKLADADPLYQSLDKYAQNYKDLQAAYESNDPKILLKDVKSDLFKPYKDALIVYRNAYIKSRFTNLTKANANADTGAALAAFKGVVDQLNINIAAIEKESDIQKYDTEYLEVKTYDGATDDYLDKATATGNFTAYHQSIIDAWDAATKAIQDRKLEPKADSPKTEYYNFDLAGHYVTLIDEYNPKIVENQNFDITTLQSYKNISKYAKNLLEITKELENKAETDIYDEACAEFLKLDDVLLAFIDTETPNTSIQLSNLGVEQKSYISAGPAYSDTNPPYKTFQDALVESLKLFNTSKIKPNRRALYNEPNKPAYDAKEEFKKYINNDLVAAFTYEYKIENLDDIKKQFAVRAVFEDDIKQTFDVIIDPRAALAAPVAASVIQKEFFDQLVKLNEKIQAYDQSMKDYEAQYKQEEDPLTKTGAIHDIDNWIDAIHNYIKEYNTYLNDGKDKPDEKELSIPAAAAAAGAAALADNAVVALIKFIKKAIPTGMTEIETLKKELLDGKKLNDNFLALSALDLESIKEAYDAQLEIHKRYLNDKCPDTLKNKLSTDMHKTIQDTVKDILDAHIAADITSPVADLKNYDTLITKYQNDCKAYCDDKKNTEADKSSLCAEMKIIIEYLDAAPYKNEANVATAIQNLSNYKDSEYKNHVIKQLDPNNYQSNIIKEFSKKYNSKINSSTPFNANEKQELNDKLNQIYDLNQIFSYSIDLQSINDLDARLWDYTEFQRDIINKYDKKYLVTHQHIVNTFVSDETYQLGQLLKVLDKDNIRHQCRVLKLIDTIVTKLKTIEKYKKDGTDDQKKKNDTELAAGKSKYQSDKKTYDTADTYITNNPTVRDTNFHQKLSDYKINLQKSTQELKKFTRKGKDIDKAIQEIQTNKIKFDTLLSESQLIYKWYLDHIKKIGNQIIDDIEIKDYKNAEPKNSLDHYLSFDELKSYRYTCYTFLNSVQSYKPIAKNFNTYSPKIIINPDLCKKYNLFPLTKLTAPKKVGALVKTGTLNKMLSAIGLPDNDKDRDAISNDINSIILQIFPNDATGSSTIPKEVEETIKIYQLCINDTKNPYGIYKYLKIMETFKKNNLRDIIYQCISDHISDVKFKFIFDTRIHKDIKAAYNACVEWINKQPYFGSNTIAPDNGIILGKSIKDPATGKTTKTPDQGVGRSAQLIDPGNKKTIQYYYNVWEYDPLTSDVYDDSKTSEYKTLYGKLDAAISSNLGKVHDTAIYTQNIDKSIIDIDTYIQTISGAAAWTALKTLTWDANTMAISDGKTAYEKAITDAINEANKELVTNLSTTAATSPVEYIQSIRADTNSKFHNIKKTLNVTNLWDGNEKENKYNLFMNALKPIMTQIEAKPLWPFYNLTSPFINASFLLKNIVKDLTIQLDFQFENSDIQELIDRYNQSFNAEFDSPEFEIESNPTRIDIDILSLSDVTNLNSLFKILRRSSSIKRNYILYLIFDQSMVNDQQILADDNFTRVGRDIVFKNFEQDALKAIRAVTAKAAADGVKPNADHTVNNIEIYCIPYQQYTKNTSIGNQEYYQRLENAGKTIVLTNDAYAAFGTQIKTPDPKNLQEKIRKYYPQLFVPKNVTAVIYENKNTDGTYNETFKAGKHKELYGSVLYAEEKKNAYTDERKNIQGIYHVLGRHYVNSSGSNDTEEFIEVGRVCTYYTAMLFDFEENKKKEILHLSLISGNQFNSGPITQYAFRRSVFQYCKESKSIGMQINVDLPKDITDAEKTTPLFYMDAFMGKPWIGRVDVDQVHKYCIDKNTGNQTKEMKNAYQYLYDIKDGKLNPCITKKNGSYELICEEYQKSQQAKQALAQVETDAKQRLQNAQQEPTVARDDNGDDGYDAIIHRLEQRLVFFDVDPINKNKYLDLVDQYDTEYKQCQAKILRIADQVNNDSKISTPERLMYTKLTTDYKTDITDVITNIKQYHFGIQKLLNDIKTTKANPPQQIKDANAEYATITTAYKNILALKKQIPDIAQVDLEVADEVALTGYVGQMNQFIATDYKNNDENDNKTNLGQCKAANTKIDNIHRPGNPVDQIITDISQDAKAVFAKAQADVQEIKQAHDDLQRLMTSAQNYIVTYKAIVQEDGKVSTASQNIIQLGNKYNTALNYKDTAAKDAGIRSISNDLDPELKNNASVLNTNLVYANETAYTKQLLCTLKNKKEHASDLANVLKKYLTEAYKFYLADVAYDKDQLAIAQGMGGGTPQGDPTQMHATFSALQAEIANPANDVTRQGLQTMAVTALQQAQQNQRDVQQQAALAAAAAVAAAAAPAPAAAAPKPAYMTLGGGEYKSSKKYYKSQHSGGCDNYSVLGWVAFGIILCVVIYLLYLIFKPKHKTINIYNFRHPSTKSNNSMYFSTPQRPQYV